MLGINEKKKVKRVSRSNRESAGFRVTRRSGADIMRDHRSDASPNLYKKKNYIDTAI